MEKNLSYVLFGLMGFSIVVFLMMFLLEGNGFVMMNIIWSEILFGIAGVSAFGFSIFRLVQDPVGAKTTFIGMVTLLVMFGISYAVASGDILDDYKDYITVVADVVEVDETVGTDDLGVITEKAKLVIESDEIKTSGTVRMVGMAIITFYMLAVVAIGVTVYSVINSFRN